jgi:hypothetical protein
MLSSGWANPWGPAGERVPRKGSAQGSIRASAIGAANCIGDQQQAARDGIEFYAECETTAEFGVDDYDYASVAQ